VACHPLGSVELRQRVVPFGTPIDTVGPQPSEERLVDIGVVTVRGLTAAAVAVERTTDLFAPGQFERLRSDQRLARPAFEPHASGVHVRATGALAVGPSNDVVVDWETIVPGTVSPLGLAAVHPSDAGLASGAVARMRATDARARTVVAGPPLGPVGTA
jgi:hypothetical protein